MYSLGRNPANEVNSDDEEGRRDREKTCVRKGHRAGNGEGGCGQVSGCCFGDYHIASVVWDWQPAASLSSPTARPVEC